MSDSETKPSRAFLPYPVSTLSPPIIPNDLTSFKSRGISQVERELQQKLKETEQKLSELGRGGKEGTNEVLTPQQLETIEKSLPGFVIPIRIDDYDFSLLPIGIHRKNVINFSAGWHSGLASLVDTLIDAKAPKGAGTSAPTP